MRLRREKDVATPAAGCFHDGVAARDRPAGDVDYEQHGWSYAAVRRTDPRIEGLLRELAPQVLGVLVRRYGQFDECEDAVQEALLAAHTQWPAEGVPANPHGWLVTVASRIEQSGLDSEPFLRRAQRAHPTVRVALWS